MLMIIGVGADPPMGIFRMRHTIFSALVLALATVPAMAQDAPAAAPAALTAAKGKMLVTADGSRLAPVYRVASDGLQIILDGRMVTVPANTVTLVNGKPTTSLSKGQVIALP
jgi:hypothetical protein